MLTIHDFENMLQDYPASLNLEFETRDGETFTIERLDRDGETVFVLLQGTPPRWAGGL